MNLKKLQTITEAVKNYYKKYGKNTEDETVLEHFLEFCKDSVVNKPVTTDNRHPNKCIACGKFTTRKHERTEEYVCIDCSH